MNIAGGKKSKCNYGNTHFFCQFLYSHVHQYAFIIKFVRLKKKYIKLLLPIKHSHQGAGTKFQYIENFQLKKFTSSIFRCISFNSYSNIPDESRSNGLGEKFRVIQVGRYLNTKRISKKKALLVFSVNLIRTCMMHALYFLHYKQIRGKLDNFK